jgi:hypothetical protein
MVTQQYKICTTLWHRRKDLNQGKENLDTGIFTAVKGSAQRTMFAMQVRYWTNCQSHNPDRFFH